MIFSCNPLWLFINCMLKRGSRVKQYPKKEKGRLAALLCDEN